ncbi:MAG: Acetyltransferase, GNAT family, partial [uncultured Solirubrobacteraceae bacterium]
ERARHAPAPPASLAPGRLRAVRADERRSGGDAPLSRPAGCRRQRRAPAPDRRRSRSARVGPVGARGARQRAPARLQRAGARHLHGALHSGDRGRVAHGALALGARPGHGGGARRSRLRLRRALRHRGGLLHHGRQRALTRADAAPGHDSRPGRRLRAPTDSRRPPAAAARPVPADARGARGPGGRPAGPV